MEIGTNHIIDMMDHANQVRILVPQHVSAAAVAPPDESTRILWVFHSHGVAWRGLVPLLLESPPSICRRLLKILLATTPLDSIEPSSASSSVRNDHDQTATASDTNPSEQPNFFQRWIRLENAPRLTILLQPPTICHLDATFASIVLRTEHVLLRLQTMTAWLSTLGGGYFFCRRLHYSLQLARQQRLLALQIGNIAMARQCSVNEAYNLIYAGKFQAAKRVLQQLEDSIHKAKTTTGSGGGDNGDLITLRQCQAARLLARRLKKVAERGLRGYHTYEKGEMHAIDDFQRIRIVVEDDIDAGGAAVSLLGKGDNKTTPHSSSAASRSLVATQS